MIRLKLANALIDSGYTNEEIAKIMKMRYKDIKLDSTLNYQLNRLREKMTGGTKKK